MRHAAMTRGRTGSITIGGDKVRLYQDLINTTIAAYDRKATDTECREAIVATLGRHSAQMDGETEENIAGFLEAYKLAVLVGDEDNRKAIFQTWARAAKDDAGILESQLTYPPLPEEEGPTWLWIVLGVGALALVLFFVLRNRKKGRR